METRKIVICSPERLKQIRKENNFSQGKLAMIMGFKDNSYFHVSSYESNGKGLPKVEAWINLNNWANEKGYDLEDEK